MPLPKSLLSWVPRPTRLALKARLLEARRVFVSAVLSYDPPRLLVALRALGVRPGDSVMLHSAFGAHFGFRGTIDQLIDVFLEAVGHDGNLLMVSLPYRSSSLQYLRNLKVFDVRRTPSMMGLVSEFFRRRAGVLRSLHPTHPVLAAGPRAEWFVSGHEVCLYPCGPGTPFEKLAAVDGKVVFFNVEFATFTFFHYLEHIVRPRMAFSLYTDEPFNVPVIDRTGESRTVTTFVFSPDAIRRRRFQVLEDELRRRRLIRRRRVGNTRLEEIDVRDSIACVNDMFDRGQYFYDVSGLPGATTGVAPAGGGQ